MYFNFKYAIIAETIFLLLIIGLMLHHTAVHVRRSGPDAQKVECFTSVQVKEGESLWEISERYYSKDYKSMSRYIQRIKALNHMANSRVDAGACLIIPYYTAQSLSAVP